MKYQNKNFFFYYDSSKGSNILFYFRMDCILFDGLLVVFSFTTDVLRLKSADFTSFLGVIGFMNY